MRRDLAGSHQKSQSAPVSAPRRSEPRDRLTSQEPNGDRTISRGRRFATRFTAGAFFDPTRSGQFRGGVAALRVFYPLRFGFVSSGTRNESFRLFGRHVDVKIVGGLLADAASFVGG